MTVFLMLMLKALTSTMYCPLLRTLTCSVAFYRLSFLNSALMTGFACFHSIVLLSAHDFRADVAAVPHLASVCRDGEPHLLGGTFNVPVF